MKLKIGFVGSPFSGKTTTAAHVFSEMKRLGFPVEFLPEEARNFIRMKRANGNWGEKPSLTDEDQLAICDGQHTQEDFILRFSGEEVMLVTDGSSLNAHFYMQNKYYTPESLMGQYDILFFSRNIERNTDSVDGNRVHDAEFSRQIDEKMREFVLTTRGQIIELDGGVDDRVAKALAAINQHIKLLEGRQ